MINNKRDNARYELNYPIMVSEGTTSNKQSFLAQILDAGLDGMCLLMAGANPLQTGSELHLSCSPARDSEHGTTWKPVHFRCKVAWQDLETSQIGLTYV